MNRLTLWQALPAILLLASLNGIPVADADDSAGIGRLFLTPQQRLLLDQQRIAGANPVHSGVSGNAPPAMAGASRVVLNGLLRRGSGDTVVWINGQPANAATRPASGVTIQRGPDAENRVTVTAGSSGARAQLKPGQIWDVASGTVIDCLQCAVAATEPATEPDTQPQP